MSPTPSMLPRECSVATCRRGLQPCSKPSLWLLQGRGPYINDWIPHNQLFIHLQGVQGAWSAQLSLLGTETNDLNHP